MLRPTDLVRSAETYLGLHHSSECMQHVAPLLLSIIFNSKNNGNEQLHHLQQQKHPMGSPLRYDTLATDFAAAAAAAASSSTSNNNSSYNRNNATSSSSLSFTLHVDFLRLTSFDPALGRLAMCEPRAADIIFSTAVWNYILNSNKHNNNNFPQHLLAQQATPPSPPFDPQIFTVHLVPRRKPFFASAGNSSVMNTLLPFVLRATAERTSLEATILASIADNEQEEQQPTGDDQEQEEEPTITSLSAPLGTLQQQLAITARINSPLMAVSSVLDHPIDSVAVEKLLIMHTQANHNNNSVNEREQLALKQQQQQNIEHPLSNPLHAKNSRIFFCSAGECVAMPLLTHGRVPQLVHVVAVVTRMFHIRRPGGVVETLPLIKVQQVLRGGNNRSAINYDFDFSATDVDVVFPAAMNSNSNNSVNGHGAYDDENDESVSSFAELAVGQLVDIVGRVVIFNASSIVERAQQNNSNNSKHGHGAAHNNNGDAATEDFGANPTIFALSCAVTPRNDLKSSQQRQQQQHLLSGAAAATTSEFTTPNSSRAASVSLQQQQQRAPIFDDLVTLLHTQPPQVIEEQLYRALRHLMQLLIAFAFRNCDGNDDDDDPTLTGCVNLASLLALPPATWITATALSAAATTNLFGAAFRASIFCPAGHSRMLFDLIRFLNGVSSNSGIVIADCTSAGACAASNSICNTSSCCAPIPLRNFTKSYAGALECVCAGQMERASGGRIFAVMDLAQLSKDQLGAVLRGGTARTKHHPQQNLPAIHNNNSFNRDDDGAAAGFFFDVPDSIVDDNNNHHRHNNSAFSTPLFPGFATTQQQQYPQLSGTCGSAFLANPTGGAAPLMHNNQQQQNSSHNTHHQQQSLLPQSLVAFSSPAGNSSATMQNMARFAERCDAAVMFSPSRDTVAAEAVWAEWLLLQSSAEQHQHPLLQSARECVSSVNSKNNNNNRPQNHGNHRKRNAVVDFEDVIDSIFLDSDHQQQQNFLHFSSSAALLLRRYCEVAKRKIPAVRSNFIRSVCRTAILLHQQQNEDDDGQHRNAHHEEISLCSTILACCLSDSTLRAVFDLSVFSSCSGNDGGANILDLLGNRFLCGPQQQEQQHKPDNNNSNDNDSTGQLASSLPDLLLHNVLFSGMLPDAVARMLDVLR